MNSRNHLVLAIWKLTMCLVVFLFLTACKSRQDSGASETTASSKPNIVFLFTDDQSYKALQALGNPEIHTPAMDRLVNSGVNFTHAYNMGGWHGAICVASRAMIISGRSVWNARKISVEYENNKQTDQTWPRLMEAAGYETYMTGKWHVSIPPDSIFRNVKSILPGMPPDSPEGYNRPKHPGDTLWQPWKQEFGGYWSGGKHWSERVKDDALSFIEQASQNNTPFFMYIAFNAPHDPRQAPREFVERYPLDSISIPESTLAEYPYAEEMGAGRMLRDEKLAPFPRTSHAIKVNRREYYAITTHLDQQIGKIIASLDEKGLLDNTYIFLTSDHGLAIGEHGLMGKQNMYDHSIRVPFILAGPNIPRGKQVEADIYLQDAMATSLELAGINKPEYVEFNSVLALARGERQQGFYDSIYGCYEEGSQRMIRMNGYKLIVYPRAKKLRLFDLSADPNELKELAGEPEQQLRLKKLLGELRSRQEKLGDPLELKPSNFNL